MKLETFFEKFELFAEAPGALEKLRGLVLEMAVQGKLSEAHAHDGVVPPEREFKVAVAALAASRGLRSQADPTEPHDRPFEIPAHWRWMTMGQIGAAQTGATPSEGDHSASGGEIPFIKPADILPNAVNYANQSLTRHGAVIGRRTAPEGTLLMVCIGTIGKASLIDRECAFNQQINALTPVSFLDPRYLLAVARAPYFQAAAWRKSSSTTIAILNKGKWLSIPVPFPPLAEQKRIVARVDDLMALCDRLEAQQQERETRRATLAGASLARFAEAPTPANLKFLFHESYAMEPGDFRRAILDLAVRGRLVPQDANEEPAGPTLALISAQKKKLHGSGRLKADKKAWVKSVTEPPHSLPESWKWIRLQDVFEISRGGSPRPAGDPRYFGGSIPWITVGEITKHASKYLTTTASGLTEEGAARSRFVNPGDLLLTNSGATLGVPKVSKIRGCINDGVAVLRLFHSFALNDFAYLYLTHQTAAFREVNQGMGQPNLNTPIIAAWLLPFPPLAEQRRIVERVDQLMTMVDRLEMHLASAHVAAEKLAEACVAEFTARN